MNDMPVWVNEFSVYATQKTVSLAQVSVYRTHFFLPIFGKMLNFCLEPRTEILADFKGSECEIAFLKFHFILEVIIHNFIIIIPRRK